MNCLVRLARLREQHTQRHDYARRVKSPHAAFVTWQRECGGSRDSVEVRVVDDYQHRHRTVESRGLGPPGPWSLSADSSSPVVRCETPIRVARTIRGRTTGVEVA